jgi:hypothetical protein
MEHRTERWRWTFAAGAVALLLGTLWWSFVQAPLMSDDAVFASTFRSSGRSVASAVGHEVQSFLRSGRMNLLNPVQAGVLFQLDPPVWAYRAFQFLLVVAALAALWGVVRELSGRRDCAFVAVLAATAALEIRRYHDGILDFHGLMPSALLFFLLSLFVSLRNTAKSWKGYVLSGALLAVSLLYNEIGYSLIPVWILVTVFRSERGKRRPLVASWMVPTIVLGIITVFVRSSSTQLYPGYKPSLVPGTVLKTFLFQASATVPYSYRLVADSRYAPTAVNYGLPKLSVLLVVAMVSAGAAMWVATRETVRLAALSTVPVRRDALLLTGIGVCFMLFPALMISTSSKYQLEVNPGMGYIPVLFQHIGFGLAIAGVYQLLAGRIGKSRNLAGVAVVVVALCGALTADTWAKTVSSLVPTKVARSMFETSIRDGLWKEVPAGSNVQLEYLGWSTAAPDITRPGGPNVVPLPGLTKNCPCPRADVNVLALANRSGEGALLIANDKTGKAQILVRGRKLLEDLTSGRRVISFSPSQQVRVNGSRPIGRAGDSVVDVDLPTRGEPISFAISGLQRLSYYM